MKGRECRKTEEHIDYICSEVNALFPIVPQHTSQGKKERVCTNQDEQHNFIFIASLYSLYCTYTCDLVYIYIALRVRMNFPTPPLYEISPPGSGLSAYMYVRPFAEKGKRKPNKPPS